MARKTKSPKFKINKIRKFKFKDNLYSIIWKNKPFKGNHFAECANPEMIKIKKEIRISPRAMKDQKKLLESLIDESVHTHWFLIDNDDVSFFSQEIADFLWKIGFRLPNNS